MTVQLPFYPQAKAFYGLSGIVPLCFLFVVGVDVLSRRRQVLSNVLVVFTALWGINSLCSFWIWDSGDLRARSGWLELKFGDRAAAEDKFRSAFELGPYNPSAICGMGAVFSGAGITPELLKLYQAAIELNPEDPQLYCGYAAALREAGQPKEAIEQIRKAVEIYPWHRFAYTELGLLLRSQGQKEAAITALQKALSNSPSDPRAYHVLVELMKEKGEKGL
jgi:tetratricopeptide (TPR) repeat protein